MEARLVCYGKTTAPSGWPYPKVTRGHLYYIHGGSGFYCINGKRYAFKPGYFYFFSQVTQVIMSQNDEDPLIHTYFDFLSDTPYLLLEPISAPAETHPALKNAFEALAHVQELDPNRTSLRKSVYYLFDFALSYIEKVYDLPTCCDERLNKALQYISANYASPISLQDITEPLHLDPAYFSRLFKSVFHITPYQYIIDYRLSVAQRLLEKGLSVKEVAIKSGYNGNVAAFSKAFKKAYDISPRELKKE